VLSEEPYDETETTTAAVAEVSLDSGDADAGAGAPVAAPRAAPRTNKSSQVSDIDFFFFFSSDSCLPFSPPNHLLAWSC